jgi:hypothetical protein
VVNYRVQAQGYSATVGTAGFFNETGDAIYGAMRSYMLVVLNGSTGAVVSGQFYDVFGNGQITEGRNAATLAADLDALTADKVAVVYTFDEPQANLTPGLRTSLKRCGATEQVLGRIQPRGAYILVGVPGAGEGTGIERYAGDVPLATNAWVDLQLQLVNGRPVGMTGGAAVPSLTAAVQQEATARANTDGYLGAQWTVRMTVGNIAGGFGISGTSAPGAQPTIDFGIRANRFFIAPPEGDTSGAPNVVPFAVQTTPYLDPVTGELLPVGTYISAAYIRDLEVAMGRFQNAFITNAMIVSLSATKITAGVIAVGEYIQSSDYITGSAGWRINGNGNAEVNNLVARGMVNGGAFTGYAWPVSGTGFHLSSSGLLLGNFNTGNYFQVTGAGDVFAPQFIIVGGTATFSGSLNVGGSSGQRTKFTNAGMQVFNASNVEIITLGVF